MEAFESFVALALEAEDFVVTGPVKFKITKKTAKKDKDEFQTHGYEVDLVASRGDKLVLASVKGFFGSNGVRAKEVTGEAGPANSKGYKMLNDVALREEIVRIAADKFGYKTSQVEMRLYGGLFYQREKGLNEIKAWAAKQKVGGGPIGVYSGSDIASVVLKMAESKTYRDHEVLMTLKVLLSAGMIKYPDAPEQRATKPSKTTSKGSIPLSEVEQMFPVGSSVLAQKDGIVGVVLGYYQDTDGRTYVKVWNEGAERSQLRSAKTVTLVP